jgi:Brp/Blh family beta-carotene 15,15'-monooxygenase
MALNHLRLQGRVFILVAFSTVALSMLFAPLASMNEWLLAGSLIVMLGVPHGALDPLFAKALPQVSSRASWLAFVILYLLLAALVVGLWWCLPAVFLIVFLAMSVLHFSGDLLAGATFFARFIYGGAVIVLPAIRHAAELDRLFSQLVGANAARPVVAALELMAWLWLPALVLVVLRSARRDCLLALEILAVGLLALIATPLLGFAVYFCFMHSPRHILRTQNYAGVTPRQLALVAVMPLLAVLGIAAAGWHLLPASPLDERMLQLLFVLLAALTLPHMVLVERVRYAGWPMRAGQASAP